MAAPTDRTPLDTARAALSAARNTLVRALADADAKAARRDQARRRFADGTPERSGAEAEAAAAEVFLVASQATERARRGELTAAIGGWVNGVTPAEDLARVPATVPLVLFPVRIETRFELRTTPPVLKVRIYPDEILINLHETALTAAEVEAAKQYYTDALASGDEREPWRQIVDKMPAPRAAYVLRVMAPSFGGGSSGSFGSSFGSGTSGGAGGGLRFPDDMPSRSETWTRPAEAVLPDRWLVFKTRNGVTDPNPTIGNPIPEPLPTTIDPNFPAARQVPLAGSTDYLFDDDIAWTVDFERAEAVGMAVTIPLTAAEAATNGTGGFDRLLVLGVKTSLRPVETSTLVEQLLDVHHYTSGLSLVPQGTPTNNTEGHPSPYPYADPQGTVSFELERVNPPIDRFRAHPSSATFSDGYKLSKLLGVPGGVLNNVAGNAGAEESHAANMNRVLWPATVGYFMDQIMAPVFSAAEHDAARTYFVNNVRARGPAPAFRVGAVPYGVLPIVSLARWAQRGSSADEQLEARMVPTLRRLLTIWKEASGGVLRLGRTTSDPLGDLVRVLATYPSAREVRMRVTTGEVTSYNLSKALFFDFAALKALVNALTNSVLRRIGHPEWVPRIRDFTFDSATSLLAAPLVAPEEELSETAPLPLDYLNFIHGANPSDLLADNLAVGDYRNTLLYKLIRHAALVEYTRVAKAEAARLNLPAEVAAFELEFIFFDITVPRPLTLEELFLLEAFPSITLGQHLIGSGILVEDFRGALRPLRGLPTRELERLLTETLDLASHRLDAWLTALATRRLRELRTAQEGEFLAPIGNVLGGYAWVENLRPATRTVVNREGVGEVELAADNGGFIHAPSMAHAATAAILRSGHLSYRAEDPARYAIDLSSARTRAARSLLDEVRAGQPLGAVLGYRFERGLHDRAASIPSINQYRYELRRLYPLVANKSGAPSTDPVDNVAARNVVDGLRLWTAALQNEIPFETSNDLPRPGTPAHTAIVAELALLTENVDAVVDMTTSESVFQLVQGNVAGAAGSLDALSNGARPPDPEIARSVRGGTALTHRVPLLLQGDTPPALPPGWGTPTPRALAEPFLDAWAGQLLGEPERVRATVSSVALETEVVTETVVSLAELGLRPLDVVALARATTRENQGSVLDRRLAFQAIGDDATLSLVSISYARVGDDGRTFPELLELARTLGAVTAEARALRAEDFTLPAETPEHRDDAEPARLEAAQELLARATAARGTLGPALAGVVSSAAALAAAPTSAAAILALGVALRGAAAYLPDSAFPASGASSDELLASAQAVTDELRRRSTAAGGVSVPAEGGQARIDAAVRQLRAVFGRELQPLPALHAPAAPELQQSLDARATLLGTDGNAPLKFLQQASAVRTPLSRLRQLGLYVRALGTGQTRLDVMQLPFVPGEAWVGRGFGDSEPPLSGRVSFLAVRLSGEEPTPAETWRGLMLDEWVELIPGKAESTAVAFNYDNPGAEAGQAVLVAVPARAGGDWQFADLLAAVEETFELAKVRAVDPELLDVGQLIPAIYVAQNTENLHTASTNWVSSLFAPLGKGS